MFTYIPSGFQAEVGDSCAPWTFGSVVLGHHNWRAGGVRLSSSGWKPEMLLRTLQYKDSLCSQELSPPFPWLAVRRPHDAWSYCERREPAGARQSSGSLPQKVREA